jgi:hypothetical protein
VQGIVKALLQKKKTLWAFFGKNSDTHHAKIPKAPLQDGKNVVNYIVAFARLLP